MAHSPAEPARIVIGMATYNAAPYLLEQLRSIQAQTVTTWTLLVRDDGSTDETTDLIAAAAREDARITVIEDGLTHLGPAGNFGRLAAVAFERGADRLFFADQDDVWLPDKMARLLAALGDAEAQHGAERAILAHSDLRLIDSHGAVITPSFMRFQRIRHEAREPLRTLLVQNFVTGCAMVVNRPLLAMAVPVPRRVPMHDWWFAVCAAAVGVLAYVPEITVDYRRHTTNTVPVRGFWRTLNPIRTNWRMVWQTGRATHGIALEQAVALLERIDRLQRARSDGSAADAGGQREQRQQPAAAQTAQAREVVQAFLAAHRRTPVRRVWQLWRLRIRSQTWPRVLALYARACFESGPGPQLR